MTIEERAANYVDKQCKGCQRQEKVGRYQGYIQGATEQQNIDIEKAWRIYNMPVCGSWTKESFTKAMKGE